MIRNLLYTCKKKKSLSVLPESTAGNVRFTMQQIERELHASEPLFKIAELGSLDHIQALAGAAVIHAVYTGMESIFSALCKELGGYVPDTEQWHRSLLDTLSSGTSFPAILDQELATVLKDYLAFRHRFRHAYTMNLDARLISEKILALPAVWNQVKTCINRILPQD